MNSDIMMDRISYLPKNIIDSILTRLPIWDVVRTSILSRSWRYEWHSLSKIKINHLAFPFHDELLQISQTAFDNKIVNIVDHILLVHRGSVDKFKLNIGDNTFNNIDRWILYLSRNGIKELTIDKWIGELYYLPSCLFSCSDLKYLELTRCLFKPPPASFKAFSNLTELFLAQLVITNKELEILMNSCPLLSRLRLLELDHCPSLKINAPNLVMFHTRDVCYHTRDVCCYFQFVNTPLLASASFGLEYPVSHNVDNKDCKIVELLGSMPVLQRLEFRDFALQHLAVGDVPPRLPLICPIKHLIVCINFEDLQELLAAFCIFRSSSFIQTLDLTVFSNKDTSRISTDGFWEGEHDLSFRFDDLEEVEMTGFTGTESELKFMEFLLANAPALDTMYIDFEENVEDLLRIVTDLIRFPRVSPKAKLILPTYRDE